jgi:hypothetical protein
MGQMVGATINTMPGGKAFGGFLKGVTGGRLDITQMNFSSAWDATQKAWSNVGGDLSKLFSKSTLDSSMNSFGIKSSLEQNIAGDFDTSNISYDAETGKLSIGPDRATGTLGNQGVGLDVADSLGLGTEGTTYQLGSQTSMLPEAIRNLPEGSFTAGATEGEKVAEELGVKDITLAGAAELISDLRGPEEVESRLPLTDYVDYSSLAVQPISNMGMGAGLASASPIQFGGYGNSLVNDIMSQNWGSIYGGGMYGFPSQMAGLTNFSSSAGQMISGIGTDPRIA